MIKRRFKMTLELVAEVEDLTLEMVHQEMRQKFDNYKEIKDLPDVKAFAERQVQLFKALLDNEEALRQSINAEFISEIECLVDGDSFNVLLDKMGAEDPREETWEVVLQPVFNQLRTEDADWFKQLIEDELLSENTEYVSDRFSVHLVDASVTPMS